MSLPFLPENWKILDTQFADSQLILHVQDQRPAAPCPHCQQLSSCLHSHYTRHPHDLACGELAVTLFLHARRFRCQNPCCSYTTFSETWPGWLESHAQRTVRLSVAQQQVALFLGGEAGHRLLVRLAEPTSADTLLRLIRRIPLPTFKTPKILGVDDFCLRKRKNYGTILIDLERHEVVDLLEGRQENTLAEWLKEHPGVEVISRDRAGEYARGAASGAPEAQQIADRFHLIGNVRLAIEGWLRQQRIVLPKEAKDVEIKVPCLSERASTNRERIQRTVALRELRQARYKQAVKLKAQGLSYKAIARQVGVARSTVTAWLKYEGALIRKTPSSGLTPYATYISSRLVDPECTLTQLYHELVKQGYQGVFSNVSAYAAWLKEGYQPPSTADQGKVAPKEKRLNSVQTAWLFTLCPTQRSETETTKLNKALERIPRGTEIFQLVQELLDGLRNAPRPGAELLTSWIAKAQATGILELSRLAKGLQKDFDAVCNALESPWSNGQTEGQVNRLKMIKRQMFGRAKFDLLKHRVLLA